MSKSGKKGCMFSRFHVLGLQACIKFCTEYATSGDVTELG